MSWTFLEEFAQWGPDSVSPRVPTRVEGEAYCRGVATRHYENFPVVTWVLPRSLRQPFYNVYAFCRWADDLGDEVGDPQRALALLNWWKTETRLAWGGAATHPVFVALNPTRVEYDLPIEPFLDLIDAFEQDQRQTRYETYDQLLGYCQRSANPVGRILLMLFRRATPQTLAWSDAICTGLQLTNFWQDVARDLDLGRIYLPQEDRDRFGVSELSLHQRTTTAAIRNLLAFEVARTRSLLLEGAPLANALPGRIGFDVGLFVQGGLRILQKIEACDYRILEHRPKLTKWDLPGCAWRVLCQRCVSVPNRSSSHA